MTLYEEVAESELFRALNHELLELVHLPVAGRIVDVGCGTGAISEMLLSRAPRADIWAVDPDPAMLSATRRRLGTRVRVVRARGEDLTSIFAPGSVDLLVLGNCIHLIHDLPQWFASANQLLVDDGQIAFNSSFIDHGEDPHDRPQYWELMLRAHRHLRRAGLHPSIATARSALAKRSLSAQVYTAFATHNELSVSLATERWVNVPAALLKTIVATDVFASGAIPDVSQEMARTALGAAIQEMLQTRPGLSIRRKWLYMVLSK